MNSTKLGMSNHSSSMHQSQHGDETILAWNALSHDIGEVNLLMKGYAGSNLSNLVNMGMVYEAYTRVTWRNLHGKTTVLEENKTHPTWTDVLIFQRRMSQRHCRTSLDWNLHTTSTGESVKEDHSTVGQITHACSMMMRDSLWEDRTTTE